MWKYSQTSKLAEVNYFNVQDIFPNFQISKLGNFAIEDIFPHLQIFTFSDFQPL